MCVCVRACMRVCLYLHIHAHGAGLIGYVLSERGALKLLRYLTFAKIELPIDLQIYKVPGLGIYATDSDWVLHDDGYVMSLPRWRRQ